MANSALRFFALAATLMCTLSPVVVDAAEPNVPSAIRIHRALDISLTLATAGMYLIPAAISGELPPNNCFPCNSNELNHLDKKALPFGNRGAAVASNWAVGAIGVGALAMSFSNLRLPGRWTWVGQDLLLIAESMSITGMTTEFVKFAVARPRPYMYDSHNGTKERKYTDEDYKSFFSGHTSLAFSVATTTATLFTLRHPGSRAQFPVWFVCMGTATATAMLRVLGGKHFYTDVAAGALVGFAIGLAVPLLHRSKTLSAASVVVGKTSVQLLFLF